MVTKKCQLKNDYSHCLLSHIYIQVNHTILSPSSIQFTLSTKTNILIKIKVNILNLKYKIQIMLYII